MKRRFTQDSIEFRNGEPLRVNPKCKQCREKCKQSFFVKIVFCPDFEPLRSRKAQRSDASIGEALNSGRFEEGLLKSIGKSDSKRTKSLNGQTMNVSCQEDAA